MMRWSSLEACPRFSCGPPSPRSSVALLSSRPSRASAPRETSSSTRSASPRFVLQQNYTEVLVQKWPVNLMHHFLILLDFTMLQGKNEKNLERYQLAEIKHGRLAMIAFSGFVHQVGPFPACCGFSPYLCSNSLGKSTRKARRKAPQPQHCNKAIRTGIGVSNQYNTISTLL